MFLAFSVRGKVFLGVSFPALHNTVQFLAFLEYLITKQHGLTVLREVIQWCPLCARGGDADVGKNYLLLLLLFQ